ncbi:DUF4157 domain-containing protein [Streptomyces sp. NPDC057617]|uniref:eCIS core domain-containing protein n=1 Tax=Streptomyces sp. NPDC057617 TaxID=3346184 RepID=UPI00368EAC72
MSTSSRSASQDAEAARTERRRKRKERARSATPEPKNIVSGAGQPLDLSVRRELEERLGHDFSRVRLHTDRDAGALTELLGADAVAVGQDIFFREGAYVSGTADGQRLLAHELLHTVQNPHGLGTLRAGRDLGAVSLPQQAIEQEAESTARDLVRDGLRTRDEEPTAVEEGQATPGWLRYATVDADRRRMEELDPATLVDRLANGVLRSLRGDPEDRSRRARTQLARLPDMMQDAVLERLESRLLSPEHERLVDLVDEVQESGLQGQNTLDAPAALPDAIEGLEADRDRARAQGDSEQGNSEAGATAAPGAESGRGTDTRRDEEARRDGKSAPGPEGQQGSPSGGGATASAGARGAAPQTSAQSGGSRTTSGTAGAAGGSSASRSGQKKGDEQTGGKEAGGKQAEAPASGTSTAESAAGSRPEAGESADSERQSAAENKRENGAGVEPGALLKTADPGARSTLAGKRLQDEEETDEDPFSLETGIEGGLGGLGGDEAEREDSAWDIELKPEDFVPETDLDVSGVPTADRIAPGSDATQQLPSFPEPPATKAEQVQARRAEEDAEEGAPDGEESASSAAAVSDSRTDSPAAPAGNRGASLTQAGNSVEQEVGPAAGTGRSSAPDAAAPVAREPKPEAGEDDRGPAGAEATGRAEPEQAREESGPAAERQQSERAAASSGSSEQTSASGSAGPAAGGGTPSSGTPASVADSGVSRPGGGTGSAGQGGAAARESDSSSGNSSAADSRAPGTNAGGDGGGDASRGANSPGDAPTSSPDAGTEAPSAAPTAASDPVPAPAPAPSPAPARPRSSGPAPRTRSGGGGTRSASGGGGGGGSRAAAAVRPKQDPAAPDLSSVAPEAGLSSAARLKPHRALEALGGVNGAVDRSVGDEHQALQSAPPAMERPSGAPQTLHGAPATSAPGQYSSDPAARIDAPEKENAQVEGDQTPEGEIPGMDIEEPSTLEGLLAGGAQLVVGAVNSVAGWFGADEDVIDSDAVVQWILDLPTEDEMLAQASVGTAPGVGLEGETGGRADEQGGEVDAKGSELHAAGQDDAARPLGEDQIYPDVPRETLTSKVPGRQGQGGGAGGGAPAAGRIPPEAVSEVAEHERGPQIQAAFGDGRKSMSDKRQVKERDTRASREQHDQQVRSEIDANTRAQATERERTKSEVDRQRAEWRTEQDGELDSLGTKKSGKIQQIRRDVEERERQTDRNVEDRRKTDEEGIGTEARTAQDNAVRERETARSDSGNWLSRAFDWIRDKLIELKNAIVRFFREARDAVVALITDFKNTVVRWINEARDFIVRKFREFTEALIQLAKDLLDAIVEIANRIRALIIRIRDAAIALVQRIAQELRRMITDLLNRIARILSDILNALKEGLRLAVAAVMTAVKAVMDFALGLLNALGEWAMIAADIIVDPGAWLSGAAASAEDGAKNHLFREVTSAIRNWLNEKIQEVLGLPRQIFDALINGGVSKEQMAKEAWDAALPQLPVIIGEIVVTKIIAKLIPGAGWVMAVIDALKSAWGALSEILKAFGAFMDYLKAVKGGNAGVLFAKAVASGVVALLELAYEALLSGIGKYVKRVGDRLRGVAAGLRKPGERAPGEQAPSQRTTPNTPNAPRDPTRPNPPDRPQATERRRPNTGRDREAEEARRSAKRANDTLKNPARPPRPVRPARPARPARPPRPTRPRPPAPPTQRRDTSAGPDTRRPDAREREPEPPQDRPRQRPETEGTKPTPRRREPSPETRAANRARRTVQAATTRTRRAQRAQNRNNDGDNRRRRDLDNNDRRMRDAYRRRRDQLQEQRRTREQQRRRQRDQRSRTENSPESKADRLRKIIARIRPKLSGTVQRGIPELAMRVLLVSMKSWYRLTDLSIQKGADERSIKAVLNPEGNALKNIEEGEELARKHEAPLLAELESQGEHLLADSRLPLLAKSLSEEQRQYQQLRKKAKDENKNPAKVTREAREAAVEMFAVREGLRPAGQGFIPAHERITMAGNEDWNVQVSEQQGSFRAKEHPMRGKASPGLIKVKSGFGRGGHYVTPLGEESGGSVVDKLNLVQEQLEHYLRKHNLGGPNPTVTARRRMKAAYFAILNRQIPNDPFFRDNVQAAETIAAAVRLMGTVEGARYPAAALMNVMAMQLADFPGSTWEDVAAHTNTMSPPHAVRASAYLVDPSGIARDKTNSKTGGLTVEGQEDMDAVTAMRANARLLLTRAFASNMSGALYLDEEQLIKKFPEWAKHNAARYLSPGGIWVP